MLAFLKSGFGLGAKDQKPGLMCPGFPHPEETHTNAIQAVPPKYVEPTTPVRLI